MRILRVYFAITTILALWLSRVFGLPAGSVPNHPAVVQSAWLAMMIWFLGGVVFLRCDRPLIQLVWASGAALQFLHVAIAFHAVHAWSHDAAFEHTRTIGGFGEGVYVNYAFTLIWCVDAMCLCASFDRYCRRPIWLHWVIHGFMAFIVFNAAVIFGSWVARLHFAIGVTWIWLAIRTPRGSN
jgi:hypothetical protein